MPGFIAASLPYLVPAAASAGQAIAQGGPKRQYKYNKKLAEDQNAMNRANQEWMLEQNRQLLKEQLEYDSPAAQMARYKAAGLNPHLIYGQGSSGNQGAPLSFGGMPGANMGSVDASYPDIAGNFIRAAQAQAQLGLTEARTKESEIRQQVVTLQAEIAKTNPMLNPQVANQVAEAMMYVATQKAQESRWMTQQTSEYNTLAERKVMAEVTALEQKLGLNTSDLQIRNKILESKEFENAIKEIQTRWLKDAEITPEHVRQGLMMILGRMIR